MAAGKPKVVATTAIAREMVGFIWAIARTVTPSPRLTRRKRSFDPSDAQRWGRNAVGNPRALL